MTPAILKVDAGVTRPDLMRAIGLLAPDSDPIIERDLWHYACRFDFNLVTTRIPLPQPYTAESLAGMADGIVSASRLLAPGIPLQSVVFGCTSASAIIGPARIENLVREALPSVCVTNPATAALAALRHIGARRIAILAPYEVEVARRTASFFADHGINCAEVRCMGLAQDSLIASVPPHVIADLAGEMTLASVDALFLSCTAARSIEAITMIEERHGLPVVTSNQATFWHAVQLTGQVPVAEGLGRLFLP